MKHALFMRAFCLIGLQSFQTFPICPPEYLLLLPKKSKYRCTKSILTFVAVFSKVIEGIQMSFFSASINVFSAESGRRLWSWNLPCLDFRVLPGLVPPCVYWHPNSQCNKGRATQKMVAYLHTWIPPLQPNMLLSLKNAVHLNQIVANKD